MHSNRVIILLLAEHAQCTFCMQEDEQWTKMKGRELPGMMSSDRWADGDAGGRSWWYCCGSGWEARWHCYFFFFFLVQRHQPLIFSFYRLLLFYSLSLSLFRPPCSYVISPSGLFYFLSSLSPLFAPVFFLFLLFLFCFCFLFFSLLSLPCFILFYILLFQNLFYSLLFCHFPLFSFSSLFFLFSFFFFSRPLPSLSLPLPLFFFLFFGPLLHLSPLVFIRRKKGERGPLPLSSHGTGVGGGRAATGQSLIGYQTSIFMQSSSWFDQINF